VTAKICPFIQLYFQVNCCSVSRSPFHRILFLQRDAIVLYAERSGSYSHTVGVGSQLTVIP